MSPIKQLHVVVLLIITAALLTGTSAGAKPAGNVLKAKLTPSSTSDEPNASGVAEFTGDWGWNSYSGWYFYGNLKVTCRGLSPGAMYTFRDELSAANQRGGWSDEQVIYFDGMVYVFRVATGTGESKLVLQGDLRR